jgi:hypothetical protein
MRCTGSGCGGCGCGRDDVGADSSAPACISSASSSVSVVWDGSEGSEGRAIEVGPSRFGTCVCALGPVNCPRPNLFAPNCCLELKLTFFPCSPWPSMLRPARCLSRLYCLHAPLRSSHDGASFCPFSCQHLVKPAAARNRMCVRDPAPERGG